MEKPFSTHFTFCTQMLILLFLKLKPSAGDEMIWENLSDADVYLAGTVMLIFGMGLYGLFISNVSPDVPSSVDRALKGSSLFGMFALKVILLPFEQNCSLCNYGLLFPSLFFLLLLFFLFEFTKIIKWFLLICRSGLNGWKLAHLMN